MPHRTPLSRRDRSSMRNPTLRDVHAVRHDGRFTTTALSVLATSLLLGAALSTSPWTRRWLYSGCAIESLLLVYGNSFGSRILPHLPLWTVLVTLNLIYFVCSTSWLLYAIFSVACYPAVFLTSWLQFDMVAGWTRKSLRKTLRRLHFTRDTIAMFNLPALEIDVDVDGLMVVRGISISLSSLTLVAHGVEVGIKLSDDIELALCVDQVRIPLFRRIEIDDIYGNVKGIVDNMTFAKLEPTDMPHDGVVIGDTPMLRAANAGSKSHTRSTDRPKLRQSLTGVSYMKEASARAGLNSVTTLSPDDVKAEEAYHQMAEDIRRTTPIYQSRARVRQASEFEFQHDRDMHAAMCADLHKLPAILHPPQLSVRVTTLQSLCPPYIRRFLHRLPYLLRLLLALLSYCHPVTISSINIAGSGGWVSAVVQQKVFRDYAENNAGLRRLQTKVSTWLTDANFSLRVENIDATSQVPMSTAFDIVAYIVTKSLVAYRTVPNSGALSQVVHLGGLSANFAIPIFLLPHHEHLLPDRPKEEAAKRFNDDGVPIDDVTPENSKTEGQKEDATGDEAAVHISVHGSLPASFDQSLLDFTAALVKASKIIENEKEIGEQALEHAKGRERQDSASLGISEDEPLRPASPASLADDTEESSRPSSPTRSLPGSLATKEGSNVGNLKGFVRTLHRSSRSVRNNLLGGVVNDRWIAKIVGKVANKLEKAHGDLGYSGEIKVALAPYRPVAALSAKILP